MESVVGRAAVRRIVRLCQLLDLRDDPRFAVLDLQLEKVIALHRLLKGEQVLITPSKKIEGYRWQSFTPPAAGKSRRFRGLICHRRSHHEDVLAVMPTGQFV